MTITDKQLREWDCMFFGNTRTENIIGDLIAEVRRLREENERQKNEIQATEGCYRSAQTKYMRCAAALEFYAKHIHWMGVSEDAETHNVLVAIKGDDPNGWGAAEEALQK